MPPPGVKIVATNRQARREFEILDTVEAGLVLRGSEVKSLRNAKAQLSEAYGRIHDGEAWLNSLHISQYEHSSLAFGHDTDRAEEAAAPQERDRSPSEPDRPEGADPRAVVACTSRDGRAKVELALARRKRLVDKRETIQRREADREAQREMARGLRRG